MPKPPETPRLSVVSSEGPPAGLGEAGRAFWIKVQREYAIRDLGGLALLEEICGAKDRLASITEAINADGPVNRTRAGGLRGHPNLQAEIQNRAFIARSLERLGISAEPVKSIGHPTRPTSWPGDH